MQTISRKIVQWLPELRSYAQALSGSRRRGDDWLRLFLDVLIENREQLSRSGNLRKQLYTLFHEVLHRLEVDLSCEVEDTASEQRLRRAVAALAPQAREALLLTSLAGFGTNDVADILGIAVTGIEHQLAEARETIKGQLSARILVVETDAPAAAKIEQALQALGHTVVGIATSDASAVALAREKQPELVLADVHGQASAARQIRSNMHAPVVLLRPPHGRRARPARRTRPGSTKRKRDEGLSMQTIQTAIREVLPAAAVARVPLRS